MTIRSALRDVGLLWPAVPSPRGAQLTALLYQMERSEKWTLERIIEAQQSQWELLFAHARQNAIFYSKRFASFETSPQIGSTAWRQISLLTRSELLQHAAALRCANIPRSHGRMHTSRTSGSTGQPVAVLRTEISQLLWQAIVLREHLWHGRDASLSNAVIRANGPSAPGPDGKHVQGWGNPFDILWHCGSTYLLDLTTDVDIQAAWLHKYQPAYLLTYPTNLDALLDQSGIKELNLKQVICVGETVSDQLRSRTAQTLQADLVANYSSQEVGYMALHCPACGQYHVQSESVFIEILDANGEPCSPGVVGRVVVTDLHNFAMPLIRYEIGDYAEVGLQCNVRPGLAALRRVLGRRRNMVLFPDGRRHFPLVGFARFNDVAPVSQYQFVQHNRNNIEVRLVADKVLKPNQLEGLQMIIQESLGYPFQLTFRQWQGTLPKTKGGKFEEFVCLAN